MTLLPMEVEDPCFSTWRDDDGKFQSCRLVRGHSGECQTATGWNFSETVTMI